MTFWQFFGWYCLCTLVNWGGVAVIRIMANVLRHPR
jgi:hypothetical protein